MAAGTLYRAPARDTHGDPVGADGRVVEVGTFGTQVGTIKGLVIGGPSWKLADVRGTVVDTTDLVGVPVSEVHQPKHRDLLVIDGVRFTVHGPPQWSTASTLTGRAARYRWWSVTARAN